MGSADAAHCTPHALGLHPGLEEAGVNLAGVLAIERYDALVPAAWRSAELLPEARSAVVLGCGGRTFGETVLASPDTDRREHPLDHFTARVVGRAAAVLASRGAPTRALYYQQRRDGQFADFVGLARECGLGAPGRLGLLLHPVYGPWMSLRALLLTAAPLTPTPPRLDFDPCRGCPAPCAAACPGKAVGLEAFDTDACMRTTLADIHCRDSCAARRACVLGREHAYLPALERMYRRNVIAALARLEETERSGRTA